MVGARKVIIDADMAMDDAVALCLALFDERLEVLAITACEGAVTAAQATRNLQALIEMLDPRRHPRLGAARPAENAPATNIAFLYGQDGLGNCDFTVAELQHLMPADKLIVDCVRSNPGQVTIICLGPVTNLARALKRDPFVVDQVHRVILSGGTLNAMGNITQVAELNFFFDPISAQEVIQSRTTKTLIPLDITSRVDFGFDLLEELPSDDTRVGQVLRKILPHAFRSFRQQLGRETLTLNDAICLLGVLEPQLMTFQEMAGQVETAGELTRGMTVFDRRSLPEWSANMEVATSIDADAARQFMLDHLVLAGRASAK